MRPGSGAQQPGHRRGRALPGNTRASAPRVEAEMLRRAGPWRPTRRSAVGCRSRFSNSLPSARPGQFAAHAAARDRAAGHEGDGAGAVVGAVGAVDPHGAAELRHHQHRGPGPGIAQRALAARPARRRAVAAGRAGGCTWPAWVSQPPSSSAAMRGPSGAASSRPAARGQRRERVALSRPSVCGPASVAPVKPRSRSPSAMAGPVTGSAPCRATMRA